MRSLYPLMVLSSLFLIPAESPHKVAYADVAMPKHFVYDFSKDMQGWQTGFADCPAGNPPSYELVAALKPLPKELGQSGTGLYFHGNNHSDDLFMFMTRQLHKSDGIVAGQSYSMSYKVSLASNAPSNCSGIGGAPGESVYVKVGGASTEPKALPENQGEFLRMNVNIGSQSQSGSAATVIGNLANGVPCTSPPRFTKIIRSGAHKIPVIADARGNIWLLIGTDSGYEGRTGIYYQKVDVSLTPVPSRRSTNHQNQAKPPSIGPSHSQKTIK